MKKDGYNPFAITCTDILVMVGVLFVLGVLAAALVLE